MKSIRVSLKGSSPDRSYPIYLGHLGDGFFRALNKLGLKSSRVLVVTSQSLRKKGHLSRLLKGLSQKGFSPEAFVIPDGEKFKNEKTLFKILKVALKFRLDRKSAILALGGGVVTDVAGLAAATYMRGINLVSIPTTLLGMVDASIGGKTGIDMPEGKNLVGAFWQPRLVWIDPGYLRTLPQREWITGFAEVIKYGVINDKSFFQWLESQIRRKPDVRKWSPQSLEKAIFKSAQTKAQVVSADERETPLKGGREILNFGHTVGHALEAATNYKSLSHGEAISIGMAAAGLLALQSQQWSEDAQLQLLSTLQVLGLPIHIPARVKVNGPRFWNALNRDKKNVAGSLRFVLPIRMGKVEVRSGIPIGRVQQAMKNLGMES